MGISENGQGVQEQGNAVQKLDWYRNWTAGSYVKLPPPPGLSRLVVPTSPRSSAHPPAWGVVVVPCCVVEDAELLATLVGRTVVSAVWSARVPGARDAHDAAVLTFDDGRVVRFGAWGDDACLGVVPA